MSNREQREYVITLDVPKKVCPFNRFDRCDPRCPLRRGQRCLIELVLEALLNFLSAAADARPAPQSSQ